MARRNLDSLTDVNSARCRLLYDELHHCRPALIEEKATEWNLSNASDGITDHLALFGEISTVGAGFTWQVSSHSIWWYCVGQRSTKTQAELCLQRAHDIGTVLSWLSGVNGYSRGIDYGLERIVLYADGPLGGSMPDTAHEEHLRSFGRPIPEKESAPAKLVSQARTETKKLPRKRPVTGDSDMDESDSDWTPNSPERSRREATRCDAPGPSTSSQDLEGREQSQDHRSDAKRLHLSAIRSLEKQSVPTVAPPIDDSGISLPRRRKRKNRKLASSFYAAPAAPSSVGSLVGKVVPGQKRTAASISSTANGSAAIDAPRATNPTTPGSAPATVIALDSSTVSGFAAPSSPRRGALMPFRTNIHIRNAYIRTIASTAAPEATSAGVPKVDHAVVPTPTPATHTQISPASASKAHPAQLVTPKPTTAMRNPIVPVSVPGVAPAASWSVAPIVVPPATAPINQGSIVSPASSLPSPASASASMPASLGASVPTSATTSHTRAVPPTVSPATSVNRPTHGAAASVAPSVLAVERPRPFTVPEHGSAARPSVPVFATPRAALDKAKVDGVCNDISTFRALLIQLRDDGAAQDVLDGVMDSAYTSASADVPLGGLRGLAQRIRRVQRPASRFAAAPSWEKVQYVLVGTTTLEVDAAEVEGPRVFVGPIAGEDLKPLVAFDRENALPRGLALLFERQNAIVARWNAGLDDLDVIVAYVRDICERRDPVDIVDVIVDGQADGSSIRAVATRFREVQDGAVKAGLSPTCKFEYVLKGRETT